VRRIWWAGLGVTLGIGLGVTLAYLAYRRFDTVRRAASPEGVAKRIDQAVSAVSDIRDEIRDAAAAREAELRQALLKAD
jgi:hypothetical protein